MGHAKRLDGSRVEATLALLARPPRQKAVELRQLVRVRVRVRPRLRLRLRLRVRVRVRVRLG